MSGHSEHEGRLVEGKRAELDPKMHHVMGQPGQTEDHHNHQYCLSSLTGKKTFFIIMVYFMTKSYKYVYILMYVSIKEMCTLK